MVHTRWDYPLQFLEIKNPCILNHTSFIVDFVDSHLVLWNKTVYLHVHKKCIINFPSVLFYTPILILHFSDKEELQGKSVLLQAQAKISNMFCLKEWKKKIKTLILCFVITACQIELLVYSYKGLLDHSSQNLIFCPKHEGKFLLWTIRFP